MVGTNLVEAMALFARYSELFESPDIGLGVLLGMARLTEGNSDIVWESAVSGYHSDSEGASYRFDSFAIVPVGY